MIAGQRASYSRSLSGRFAALEGKSVEEAQAVRLWIVTAKYCYLLSPTIAFYRTESRDGSLLGSILLTTTASSQTEHRDTPTTPAHDHLTHYDDHPR